MPSSPPDVPPSSMRALLAVVAASLFLRLGVVVVPHRSSFASAAAAWTAASPGTAIIPSSREGHLWSRRRLLARGSGLRGEAAGAAGGGASGGSGGGIVVMGKIIIDEYLRKSPPPADENDEGDDPSAATTSVSVSVGGGGPQAAWGAAAALATLDLLRSRGRDDDPYALDVPPQQPVVLVAPVGPSDWRDEVEGSALRQSLGSALRKVRLFPGPDHLVTPRIQIWHDENQVVQWRALNDSFGPSGADTLWGERPDAVNVLSALDDLNLEEDDNNEGLVGGEPVVGKVALHAILEMGESAPGAGLDGMPLWDPRVLGRIEYVGVEPVAFPEEPNDEGWSIGNPRVSEADATSCAKRLGRLVPNLDFVCPDGCLYGSMDDDGGGGFWSDKLKCHDVAVRDGPKGSFLVVGGGGDADERGTVPVPAAKLRTVDGKPVNPTGAGNAYAGAFAACRGAAGLPPEEAASVASAVGAVVCEHENLPPWGWDTVRRVAEAVDEVRRGMDMEESSSEKVMAIGMGRDVIGGAS